MGIEEIPSDKLIEMTELFHRAFNAAGCDPMCHNCQNMLEVGKKFKLATIKEVSDIIYWDNGKEDKQFSTAEKPYFHESREVMLCEFCSAEMYQEKQIGKYKEAVDRINKPKGGCFRINGKIVH